MKMAGSFNSALAHFRQGDYLNAIRLLTSATGVVPTDAAALEILGASFFKTGQLAEARNIFRKLVQIDPKSKHLHNTLGAIYKDEKRYDDALNEFREALTLDPQYLPALINCATTHNLAGDISDAILHFRKALILDGGNVACLRQIADLYYRNHDYNTAEMYLRRLETAGKLDDFDTAKLAWSLLKTNRTTLALEFLRDKVESSKNPLYLKKQLAIVALNADEIELSARLLDEIIVNDPHDVDALLNRGNIEYKREIFESALSYYHRVVELDPSHIDALNNSGVVYDELGKTDESFTCFEKILTIDPHNVNALIERGKHLNEKSKFDDAIECYDKVLRIDPNNWMAYYNRGVSQHEKGDYEESAKSCIEAIIRNPRHDDAQYNLGINLLALGQFNDAWRYYFRRERFLDTPTPFSPITPGQNFFGKRVLFVRSQGLGDELFFMRFLPQIKAQGAWVAYRPDPKIRSLVSRMPFIDRVVGLSEVFNDFDFCFSIDDAAFIVDMKSEDRIPPPIYLSPLSDQSRRIERDLGKLSKRPLIGITWRGGSSKKKPNKKSLLQVLTKTIDLHIIADTLEKLDGTFIILQRHPHADEIAFLKQKFGNRIIDLSAANDDLELMLALLEKLDFYIGVSNTNTHLRAMTGRIAHILVPFPPEWRWYFSGKFSPWFPQFPVYRQSASGKWTLQELISDVISTDTDNA